MRVVNNSAVESKRETKSKLGRGEGDRSLENKHRGKKMTPKAEREMSHCEDMTSDKGEAKDRCDRDIVKRAKMGAALQSVTDILLYMNRTREL